MREGCTAAEVKSNMVKDVTATAAARVKKNEATVAEGGDSGYGGGREEPFGDGEGAHGGR